MDRLTRWALRRTVRAGEGARGRLVWVDAEGTAHDLGLFATSELRGLAWAHRVADRTTRERYERVRLAALRHAASRIDAAAKRVEKG